MEESNRPTEKEELALAACMRKLLVILNAIVGDSIPRNPDHLIYLQHSR